MKPEIFEEETDVARDRVIAPQRRARLREVGDADQHEQSGDDREQAHADAFVPPEHAKDEDNDAGEEREIARGQAVHRRLRRRADAKRRA